MTIALITGSNPLAYTAYSYIYTANRTFPTLSFGFSAPSNMFLYLDDVSVVDTSNSSAQLLNNPTFAASSTAASGWDAWCSNMCVNGSVGIVSTTSCLTDNCYRGQCTSTNTDYLVQTFPAIIGRTYNITFYLQRIKGGGPGSPTTLFVGIM